MTIPTLTPIGSYTDARIQPGLARSMNRTDSMCRFAILTSMATPVQKTEKMYNQISKGERGIEQNLLKIWVGQITRKMTGGTDDLNRTSNVVKGVSDSGTWTSLPCLFITIGLQSRSLNYMEKN